MYLALRLEELKLDRIVDGHLVLDVLFPADARVVLLRNDDVEEEAALL